MGVVGTLQPVDLLLVAQHRECGWRTGLERVFLCEARVHRLHELVQFGRSRGRLVEVGPRDVAGGNVALIKRTALYTAEGKLNSEIMPRADFAARTASMLADVQDQLLNEARQRLDQNIARDVTDLATHYKADDKVVGWVEVQWSRPTGAGLTKVVDQLKALKLTMRNVPMDAAAADGLCLFTGEKAVERILIGRTY